MGILFRKGDALQALRDATVVALDKTGTLTRGQPQLTDLHVLDHADESRTLQHWHPRGDCRHAGR